MPKLKRHTEYWIKPSRSFEGWFAGYYWKNGRGHDIPGEKWSISVGLARVFSIRKAMALCRSHSGESFMEQMKLSNKGRFTRRRFHWPALRDKQK